MKIPFLKDQTAKSNAAGKAIKKAKCVVLTMVFASALACAPPTAYRNPDMDMASIYTVGIMPLVNMTRDQVAGDRVRDVFMTELLTNGVYVIPLGEVSRQLSIAGIANPSAPTTEEIIKLGKMLKAEAVITGAVKEYGEVWSGSAMANIISISVQLTEVQTGTIVSSASTTKGGIGPLQRMFGGGGEPMNDVTEKAVKDVIERVFK